MLSGTRQKAGKFVRHDEGFHDGGADLRLEVDWDLLSFRLGFGFVKLISWNVEHFARPVSPYRMIVI